MVCLESINNAKVWILGEGAIIIMSIMHHKSKLIENDQNPTVTPGSMAEPNALWSKVLVLSLTTVLLCPKQIQQAIQASSFLLIKILTF